MTISFKIGNDSSTSEVEISSFDDFVEFLWSNLVGKDKSDSRILGFWNDAYVELLAKPQKAPMMFSRYRAKEISHLIIVEVSNPF